MFHRYISGSHTYLYPEDNNVIYDCFRSANRSRNDSGYLSSSPAWSSRSASVNTAYDTDPDMTDDLEEEVFEQPGHHGNVDSSHCNDGGVHNNETSNHGNDNAELAGNLYLAGQTEEHAEMADEALQFDVHGDISDDDDNTSTPTLTSSLHGLELESLMNENIDLSSSEQLDTPTQEINVIPPLFGLPGTPDDLTNRNNCHRVESINMECDQSSDEELARIDKSSSEGPYKNCIGSSKHDRQRPVAPNPGQCTCDVTGSKCKLHYAHMLPLIASDVSGDHNHFHRVNTAPNRLEPETGENRVTMNGHVAHSGRTPETVRSCFTSALFMYWPFFTLRGCPSVRIFVIYSFSVYTCYH